ncbi:hypothetical protein ADN00_11170 [Ornatilinea apprima]|uniref:Glycerol transporter n=1 Tax=Ornatilinea apprima TaxID=1134406 RepID=A0A0P6XKH2_9CHLR|nr:aquaporin [Ornatilinea apprima]KPL76523.1 hypothetical protein ADN00_11170 [Ornatilinea apprima]NMC53931.1 aquaporin family protein [Chloroflexota bacterium]
MKPKEFIAVVVSTFVLIILGDGVVANVGLAPRLAGSAYNWNTITLGWAFAVIAAGVIAGADNNPAVTFAMAVRGQTPWSKLLPIILAEFIGAFLGAVAVYLVYRDGLIAAGMPNVWSTGPGSVFGNTFWGGDSSGALGSYSLLTACVAEFFGTVILMWGVLAVGDSRNASISNLGPFIVGGIVLVIGLCLGGPSGYSINPARDLGPRLFGLLAGTKGLFDGIYWLLPPVLIPMVAAPVGGYLYDLFFGKK